LAIKTFDDIADYAWAEKQIRYLASKGIIKGTSEREFSPGKPVTRAEYLTLLIRMSGLEAPMVKPFEDVGTDDYFYRELSIAKQLGIVSGIGGNLFRPNDRITRQDMMVMSARVLQQVEGTKKSSQTSVLDGFRDVRQVSPYALDSIAYLVERELIQGDGKRLYPADSASRAEASVLIYRMYKMLNES
jgi:hypothetical protein